ncbi:hypothetical protein SD78_2577 [Bacillus badius]|nr:hypothetical protein SD78_2577 [Bacillus badius]
MPAKDEKYKKCKTGQLKIMWLSCFSVIARTSKRMAVYEYQNEAILANKITDGEPKRLLAA